MLFKIQAPVPRSWLRAENPYKFEDFRLFILPKNLVTFGNIKQVAELEDIKSDLINQNVTYEALNASLEAETKANGAKAENAEKKAIKAEKKMDAMTANIEQVKRYAAEYVHSPDEWLPEPNKLETARSYRSRIITFITDNIVKIIQPLYAACVKFQQEIGRLKSRNKDLSGRVDRLQGQLKESDEENKRLKTCESDLNRVRNILGDDAVDEAIRTAKAQEQTQKMQKQGNRYKNQR